MVDLHTHALQPGLERFHLRLGVIAGQHHAADIKPEASENVNQADHIPVVGDAQIAPDFVLFNVARIDGDDHLHLIPELEQHPQLGVRLEAGQHPGGVVIVIKLAAEFQIQLAAELIQPPPDMLRLHLKILLIVKSAFYHIVFLVSPESIPIHFTPPSPK